MGGCRVVLEVDSCLRGPQKCLQCMSVDMMQCPHQSMAACCIILSLIHAPSSTSMLPLSTTHYLDWLFPGVASLPARPGSRPAALLSVLRPPLPPAAGGLRGWQGGAVGHAAHLGAAGLHSSAPGARWGTDFLAALKLHQEPGGARTHCLVAEAV